MPSQAVNVTGRSLDPVTKHLTIKVEPFLRSALFATNDCKGYHLSREGAPGFADSPANFPFVSTRSKNQRRI